MAVKFAQTLAQLGYVQDARIPVIHSDRGKMIVGTAILADTPIHTNIPEGGYRIVVPAHGAAEHVRVFISEWIGAGVGANLITAIVSGTGGVMRATRLAHGRSVGDTVYLQRLLWTGTANPHYGDGRYNVTATPTVDTFEVNHPFPVGGTFAGLISTVLHTSYAPFDTLEGENDAQLIFLGPGPHDFDVRIGKGADDVTGGFGGGPSSNLTNYPLGWTQLIIRHKGAAARDIYIMARF